VLILISEVSILKGFRKVVQHDPRMSYLIYATS